MFRFQRRRRRQGFTLMEVLLVLAILVILGSMVGFFIAGMQKGAYQDLARTQIGMFENQLDVYRLHIGVSGDTFVKVAPGQDGAIQPDYTEFDQVLPHPEYGGAKWVCVVNPSEDTFAEVLRPLLAEAYARGRDD